MRIVFMGTPEFAVPSLKALCDNGYDVVGVFTQPDRPKGRGGKVQMSPVKEVALEYGIPVFQPQRIRVDGLDDLKALAPDLKVIACFDDLIAAGASILTLGQYLQPSPFHLKVERFVSPDTFARLKEIALSRGFERVAAGPMVRSSYRAGALIDEPAPPGAPVNGTQHTNDRR